MLKIFFFKHNLKQSSKKTVVCHAVFNEAPQIHQSFRMMAFCPEKQGYDSHLFHLYLEAIFILIKSLLCDQPRFLISMFDMKVSEPLNK